MLILSLLPAPEFLSTSWLQAPPQQGDVIVNLYTRCPLLQRPFLQLVCAQIEKGLPYVIVAVTENNRRTFYDALAFARSYQNGCLLHTSEQCDFAEFYIIELRDHQQWHTELLANPQNDFIKKYLLACMHDDSFAKEILRARNSLIRHFFERRQIEQSIDWLARNYRDFRTDLLNTTMNTIAENPDKIIETLQRYLFKERLHRIKEVAQRLLAFGAGLAVGYGIPATLSIPLHLIQFAYVTRHICKNIRSNSRSMYLGTLGSSIVTIFKTASECFNICGRASLSAAIKICQLAASTLSIGVAIPALSSGNPDPLWVAHQLDQVIIERQ